VAREDAMERPATPVGPIHHRGDAESMAQFVVLAHVFLRKSAQSQTVQINPHTDFILLTF
jgi:hypothetical protein